MLFDRRARSLARIRVVISPMSELLRDVITRVLSDQPDMEVVDLGSEPRGTGEFQRVLVIESSAGGVPARNQDPLVEDSLARFVVIGAGGRQASVHVGIGEASPEKLRWAIRRAARGLED